MCKRISLKSFCAFPPMGTFIFNCTTSLCKILRVFEQLEKGSLKTLALKRSVYASVDMNKTLIRFMRIVQK